MNTKNQSSTSQAQKSKRYPYKNIDLRKKLAKMIQGIEKAQGYKVNLSHPIEKY